MTPDEKIESLNNQLSEALHSLTEIGIILEGKKQSVRDAITSMRAVLDNLQGMINE